MKFEFTSQSFVRVVLALLALGMVAEVDARIPRSQAEVRAYRKEHPCPSTEKVRGACPGYQVDHVIPLCAGGPDHRSNMHWLSVEDHRWKTFVDARECRKFAWSARQPAREPLPAPPQH